VRDSPPVESIPGAEPETEGRPYDERTQTEDECKSQMNPLLDIQSMQSDAVVAPDDPIAITGANGFIGTSLVEVLLERGFVNLRCLVRSRRNRTKSLYDVLGRFPAAHVQLIEGNLRSRDTAAQIARDARLIFHLAAGMEKSFPGSYLNTVVTTRNLLDAVRHAGTVRRFVNVSSLAVYSNRGLGRHALLDETCALESHPIERDEAYVYAKLKQDELVVEYGHKHGIPYVLLRPGAVYGAGKSEITGRVGIGTFGIFLHLGGRNTIPFTHVRNCAEAIALAGITESVDGEVFNIVDDDLPTSRQFMAGYRKHVGRRRYLSVPYPLFYLFCLLWERYSSWSKGQLPPTFNRYRCSAYWKGNRYSNRRLKERLRWRPSVSYRDGSRAYYEYLRGRGGASC
jgi:nucleoside-diphosphate-sugar epimerase